MTIQTTTDETSEAQLRADDQDVLWLIDATAVADEAKSVTRQLAHATAYATRKGWTVRDEFVYVDDGISGAEFASRPGFVRLMAALKPRPPFQVLIMSEESRLGREAIETAYALKQLIQARVAVWFYLEDRQRTFDSPTDKLLMSVTAFARRIGGPKPGCGCMTRCSARPAPDTFAAGGCLATRTSTCWRPRVSGRTSSGAST
jgi:Resolvase, N terminal domain